MFQDHHKLHFWGFYECIYAYQLLTSGKRDILSSTELVFFFPMNFVKLFCKNLEEIPGYHHECYHYRIKLMLYSIHTWLVLVRSAGLCGLFKNVSTVSEYPFSAAK